jgi:hypothetical protein
MEIRLFVTTESDDLVETLTQEQAEQLIKEIDSAMVDYEFTERIAKHLISELAKECAAVGEVFDINSLVDKV